MPTIRDLIQGKIIHQQQVAYRKPAKPTAQGCNEKNSVVYEAKFSGFRPRHVAQFVPGLARRAESNRVLR